MPDREEKETIPCLAPVPDVTLTSNPRESITWPNGWIDFWDQPRRLNQSEGLHPFERLVPGSGWEPTFAMGPMPHKRVGHAGRQG